MFYSVIKVYNKENRIKVKIKGGIQKKGLSELHIAKLESWIAEDASITLKSMKRMLTEEFGINVCTTTIHNYLGKFAYTLKIITPLPPKRNSMEAINKRVQSLWIFWGKLMTVIYFLLMS